MEQRRTHGTGFGVEGSQTTQTTQSDRSQSGAESRLDRSQGDQADGASRDRVSLLQRLDSAKRRRGTARPTYPVSKTTPTSPTSLPSPDASRPSRVSPLPHPVPVHPSELYAAIAGKEGLRWAGADLLAPARTPARLTTADMDTLVLRLRLTEARDTARRVDRAMDRLLGSKATIRPSR